jgi:hypothetical protein
MNIASLLHEAKRQDNLHVSMRNNIVVSFFYSLQYTVKNWTSHSTPNQVLIKYIINSLCICKYSYWSLAYARKSRKKIFEEETETTVSHTYNDNYTMSSV